MKRVRRTLRIAIHMAPMFAVVVWHRRKYRVIGKAGDKVYLSALVWRESPEENLPVLHAFAPVKLILNWSNTYGIPREKA